MLPRTVPLAGPEGYGPVKLLRGLLRPEDTMVAAEHLVQTTLVVRRLLAPALPVRAGQDGGRVGLGSCGPVDPLRGMLWPEDAAVAVERRAQDHACPACWTNCPCHLTLHSTTY